MLDEPIAMHARLLIDAIVRQTTVLIAQLATSGGVRAPLAHIANQVFLDLAAELDAQGVSRKVSADMFGMALRTYLRKIQRLNESSTDRGRSLWEAVLQFVSEKPVVTRLQVLERFYRDDEALVRGVLHDLVETGLVFCSGTGQGAAFRAATAEELGSMQKAAHAGGADELLWALVYRQGPVTREQLLALGSMTASELDAALGRLRGAGRIVSRPLAAGDVYLSQELFIPVGADAGWEAAVFDHFQAVVKTICCRLRQDPALTGERSAGGSTYTFEVWEGHPFAAEVYALLGTFRERLSELRQRVEAHNAQHGMPEARDDVVVYAGQCVLPQRGE